MSYSLQAPCEAEAQCAAMVKAGVVYATATEDMDSLTFGSNIMLRHLTTSEAKLVDIYMDLCWILESLLCVNFFYLSYIHRKLPIREIHLDKLLSELGINQKEVPVQTCSFQLSNEELSPSSLYIVY